MNFYINNFDPLKYNYFINLMIANLTNLFSLCSPFCIDIYKTLNKINTFLYD